MSFCLYGCCAQFYNKKEKQMRKEIIASIIILVLIFNACELRDAEYAARDFPYEILPGEMRILRKVTFLMM